MTDRLRDALARITRSLRKRRAARERQEKIESEKERGFRAAQQRRAELLNQLAREGDPEIRARLKAAIREAHEKASRRKREANHARERIGELASKIAWGVKRQTVLRRKLREADRSDPVPESWMANGHEYGNLTDRARKLLAIAVVTYGLYCTSITRNWGTGSFHEDVPTRGFDCAGARMTDFQRDLRYGRVDGFELGDLLELFGPDNAACADNGVAYAMSEGSEIETLHDNHTHAFVY